MKLRPDLVSPDRARACRRSGIVLAVALVLALAASSATAAGPPAGRPANAVTPNGGSMRATPGQPGLYWIYWGAAWESQAAKAAAAGERPFSPRAAARLAKVGAVPSALDPANRPIPGAFLDHLRSLGIEIRVASRFLRAVSALLTAEDLARLGTDPGIVDLVPVVVRQGFWKDKAEGAREDANVATGAGRPAWQDRIDDTTFGGTRAGARRPGPAATDTLPDPRKLTRADYGASWGQCEQLGVTALHRLGYAGQGVLVCLLDGGFYPEHDAFAQTDVVATRDFVEHDRSVWYDPARPIDPYNRPTMEYHGTYTFSALGGFAAGAVIGPAYGAQFALGRTEVVESETRMEEDTYVAGLEWADSLGADVVSTSLGYLQFDNGFSYWPEELDGRTAVTSRAAALLARRGVVLVTAMGNKGPQPGTLMTPADAESVVAVGAVDWSGDLAYFSSRGPNARGVTKPDVCARGVATACATASARNAYTSVDGTSLATPLIGGLAALLLEAHPDWTPWQLQQALHRSGDQAREPDDARGWGVPDGLAALGAIDPTDGVSSQLSVRSVSWVEEEDPESGVVRDSLASPGQRGRLRIVLANEGDRTSSSAWLVLAGPPDGIVAAGDSVRVESIQPGEVITVAAGLALAVAADHPAPQRDRLPLRFRTDLGAVYYRIIDLAVVTPTIRQAPYPNPLIAPGELTLDLPLVGNGPVRLAVFDAAGRLVARPSVVPPALQGARLRWTPDASLPSGTYYLRIESAAGVRTHRFVLLRPRG
jgi:hypothetical protein